MKINAKSDWDQQRIVEFLQQAEVPVRLSFADAKGQPRICSLWFTFEDGALWSASHQNAFLVKQLQSGDLIAFEVSTNDYPYKGVRGQARVELTRHNAAGVLQALIAKYLGDSNQQLAQWLLSRADEEYVIKMVPTGVNAWDFSHRMEK